MTVQGFQGSDAQVVTEEEVNRRRVANERKRAVAPPRAGAPRLPLTPHGGPEEDPRRALCSNAELLDALQSEPDADAALDLYQAATQPTADHHETLTEPEPAHSGDGELDVDEILEALERHHRGAQPTRPHTSDARGTADLAPSTLTTRPRGHGRARSRPGRQPLARWKATRAAIGLVAIVGLCAWAALSVTGTPHAATAPARPSRVSRPLTGAGLTSAAAESAQRAVADRVRSAGIALSQAGERARAAAAARTRRRHAQARARQLKRARALRASHAHAAATTVHAAHTPSVSAQSITPPQTTNATQAPAQNATSAQSSHPAAASAPPAFGSDGTLGPGHSPDS